MRIRSTDFNLRSVWYQIYSKKNLLYALCSEAHWHEIPALNFLHHLKLKKRKLGKEKNVMGLPLDLIIMKILLLHADSLHISIGVFTERFEPL
jgi:hypothetical protein